MQAFGLRTHAWNTAWRSMLLLAGFPLLLAVMADKHYVVSKEPGDVPQTHLDEVTGEARTAEIARMLSGDQSEASLAHARQMLEEARA